MEWIESWKIKNPEFNFCMWREKTIEMFSLENKKLYNQYMEKEIYYGASDVARIEILNRYGGIFMDADSICTNTIENEEFLNSDFFAVNEFHPGRIANGVIGSIPGHPILKKYIEEIGKAKKTMPVWNTIGGAMLTRCIEEYGKEKVTILPAYSFYPVNHNGQKAEVIGKNYAEQLWASTKKLYN